MKFTTNAAAFAAATSAAARIVIANRTYPILENILLTAEAGRVSIRATDLDIEILQVIEAEVVEDGTITVPARPLSEVLRKFDQAADVTMETPTETTVKVRSGRSNISLATLSPESFPSLSAGEFDATFEADSALLLRALDRGARFYDKKSADRFYLDGVYMHIVGGNLRMVSTDAVRFTQYEIPAPPGSEAMPAVIVPDKAVGEIRKVIEGAPVATVSVSSQRVAVTSGESRLVAKLIEHPYVDYSRISAGATDKTLVAPAADMLAAVDRVGTLVGAGAKGIKVRMRGNDLTLEINHQDHGLTTETMEVEYGGDEFVIGYNVGNLKDLLAVVGKERVRFDFSEPNAPALLRNEADPAWLGAIYPMRV